MVTELDKRDSLQQAGTRHFLGVVLCVTNEILFEYHEILSKRYNSLIELSLTASVATSDSLCALSGKTARTFFRKIEREIEPKRVI